MAFFNPANFGRDYFKYGLGKTIKDTIGGLYLSKKLKNIFANQQPEDKLKTPIVDLGANKAGETGSSPKQDLQGDAGKNITVSPEVQQKRPSAGGEEGDMSVPVTGYGTDEQPTQETTTQEKPVEQPVQSQNTYNPFETPETRRKYNQALINNVMNYVADARKFGDIGANYSSDAMKMLGLSLKYEPQQPKFDPKSFFTDKSGNVYHYVYNFATNGYSAVPIKDASGKQIQSKLPEYDKDRMRVTSGENGNAFIYDMSKPDQAPYDTKIPIEQFDYKYGLEQGEYNLDKWFKEEQIGLKGRELDIKEKKKSGTGDGTSGNESEIGEGDELAVTDLKGNPVKPEYVENPLTGEKQLVYNVNGNNVPANEILKYVKQHTYKKGKSKITTDDFQLGQLGVKVGSKRKLRQGFIDNYITNLSKGGWGIEGMTPLTQEQIQQKLRDDIAKGLITAEELQDAKKRLVKK